MGTHLPNATEKVRHSDDELNLGYLHVLVTRASPGGAVHSPSERTYIPTPAGNSRKGTTGTSVGRRRGVGVWLCVWREEEGEGGGGGADIVHDTRVYPGTPTRIQLIKKDWCQCTSPFGWTDQPGPLKPVPSRGRFQAFPAHPKPRKKIVRLTHLSLPLPRKGCNTFHRLGVGCPTRPESR